MAEAKYSIDFAFTVTLKPNLYCDEPHQQYDKTYSQLIQILKSKGSFVTCVAELTKSYNLHMHGIIKFDMKNVEHKSRNLMLRFTNLFRKHKLFGFVNIRQIDDFPKWKEYISKDIHETRSLLNRPPILIDNYEIFDNMNGIEYYFQDDM